MPDILPPAPIDAPFASYNWTDWYRKVRDAINQSTEVAWAIITGTPTTLAGYGITDGVSTSRTITTTFPLSGGGNLSANRTLSVFTFAGSDEGVVPISLGGTTNFLRADGAWAPSTVTWSNVSSTPTTLAGYGITDGQNTSEKNAANGYAGLNASSRITKGVDTTDDIIVDLATKGLVLKDTQGTPHYWRVTVSTTGVLTTADLGTSKP